jgi:hypothetical protein
VVSGAPALGPQEEGGIDPESGDDTHGCKVSASWIGTLDDEFLEVHGHFTCQSAVWGFEIQVALQLVEWGGVTGGAYKTVGSEDAVFTHSSHNELVESFDYCKPGDWYRAWVWGRFWYKGGGTVWQADEIDGRLKQCENLDGEVYLP